MSMSQNDQRALNIMEGTVKQPASPREEQVSSREQTSNAQETSSEGRYLA